MRSKFLHDSRYAMHIDIELTLTGEMYKWMIVDHIRQFVVTQILIIAFCCSSCGVKETPKFVLGISPDTHDR